MVVGFACASRELGSNIIYAKALYAIKALFPCRLIVFGNDMTTALYSQASHIDTLLDIGLDVRRLDSSSKENMSKQIALINSFACDYLILSDAKSSFLRFGLATNAKRVLCARKFVSLIAWRARSLPIYASKTYKQMSFENILLHLVRLINPKAFDAGIARLDFSPARLFAPKSIQAQADKILRYVYKKRFCQNRIAERLRDSRFIAINPFNVNNAYSLPQHAWLELIEKVCKTHQVLVITYPTVHREFMQALRDYKRQRGFESRNLIIFANNKLPHLIALITRASLCISPSTGTTHLALNLGIPSIGLYAQYDKVRWGHKDLHYITLEAPRDQLTKAQCQDIIQATIALLEQCLREAKTP